MFGIVNFAEQMRLNNRFKVQGLMQKREKSAAERCKNDAYGRSAGGFLLGKIFLLVQK
jgi:hypothetical protein